MRVSARQLAPAVLAVGLLGVASCSEVLDNVEGYFEDDEATERVILQNEENQDFPKLSEVPNAPRPISTREELDRLSEGLIADRDEARYTNETLRSRYAEDSLAEERRIGNMEPASEAVVRDRRTDTAEERIITGMSDETTYGDGGNLVNNRPIASDQTISPSEPDGIGGLSETRVSAVRQTSSRSGVMTISQFRAMFNERFDASGRSPYQLGERQQVSTQVGDDGLSRVRALNPGSADMDMGQADISSPSLPARESSDSDQGAVSFQAASISFATGSASLNSSDRAALKDVVKLHRKYGGTVHVVGHASQRTRDMGSENHRMVNFSLSLDRATAVSMELARLGVPAEAVTVIARSDNEPIAHEYMPEGEAYNRRADVYLEY